MHDPKPNTKIISTSAKSKHDEIRANFLNEWHQWNLLIYY